MRALLQLPLALHRLQRWLTRPLVRAVMGVLGEPMEPREVGAMVEECKAWAQPQHDAQSSEADAVFEPADVRGPLDMDDKSAQISADEFQVMLTRYWVSRKYGSKRLGAVRDKPFRRMDKDGLKQEEADQQHVDYVNLEKLEASQSGMPPVPGWMADIAAGHQSMSADKRVPDMFWYFLRRKMEQVLIRANKGGIHEVGFFRRQEGDPTDKASFGWSVRDTSSRFSAVWDLFQVVLLSYVVVMVPYQAGFDESAALFSGLWWWELLVDTYFVVDIGLNFRTPFYDKQGRIVFSSKAMALHYARGWLFIDVGSCASLLQYFFLITDSGDSDTASKARATKVLRLLRLAKLLRLARLKRIVDRLGDDIVTVLAPLGNVGILLLGTFMCMHLVSCFWYLGTQNADFSFRKLEERL